MMIDRISLLLVIIGALNWGSVALFQLDLVVWVPLLHYQLYRVH